MNNYKYEDKKIDTPENILINGKHPQKLTKKVQVNKEVFTGAVLQKREKIDEE